MLNKIETESENWNFLMWHDLMAFMDVHIYQKRRRVFTHVRVFYRDTSHGISVMECCISCMGS